jgi:hypothetical protein
MSNAAPKLSKLIGSFSEKKEDILNYNLEDLNEVIKDLLTFENAHKDYSNTSVISVLAEAVKNPFLDAAHIGPIACRVINESNPRLRYNKRHETIVHLLNHPNIKKNDYLKVLECYFIDGTWLDEEITIQLKDYNQSWQKDIENLLSISIPSLRRTLVSASKLCFDSFLGKLMNFLNFYKVKNVESIEKSLCQLVDKMGPLSIRKKKFSDHGVEMFQIPEEYSNLYFNSKYYFLEKFNALPFDPNSGYVPRAS